MFDTIIVPQGREYYSVCRGLNSKKETQPKVIPIPLGIKPLTNYLCQQPLIGKKVLLMGVCGSLSPDYGIGDIVIYQDCLYQEKIYPCHPLLTRQLQQKLKLPLVRGLTSDYLISKAEEKRYYYQLYQGQVVDMEGVAALKILQEQGSDLAIIRVVSDDSNYNIPNLAKAIPDGNLQPLPLAIEMIKQPVSALRLIRGSLIALKKLEYITRVISII